MSYRVLASIAALAGMIAAPLPAQTQKASKSKTSAIPRTPDGHPDLQGIWTNATITPLERPAQFANKPTLTDAEAAAFEKKNISNNDIDNPNAPLLAQAGSAGTGAYNDLFIDRGSELERIDGVKHTSLIVDPPDGKVPMLASRMRPRGPRRGGNMVAYDDVKKRPLSERCLLGFGSTSGPPMLPVLYNNNYQIVQTPQNIMILVEMVHDARIIRMNSQHIPQNVRRWFGDSIGHWEGDTLVVDTTNFTPQTRFHGSGENLHIIERFQRVDAKTILYKATMEDSSAWSRPWTVEYPFLATPGPIYEYACHEGNYAIDDVLGGARKMEQQKTQTK